MAPVLKVKVEFYDACPGIKSSLREAGHQAFWEALHSDTPDTLRQ